MRVALLALLSVPFLATEAGPSSILRRRLDQENSDAPTPSALVGAEFTPQPTPSDGFGGGGDTPVPTPALTEGEPTMTEPTVDEPTVDEPTLDEPTLDEPTNGEGFDVTPDPSDEGFEETTEPGGGDEDTPFPVDSPVASPSELEPTIPAAVPYPEWETPAPSPRPESTYIANDDDPLQPLNPEVATDDAWKWTDSSMEEVEHDRTVLIALSVTFAVGLCLAIFTAQQMLENPDGCCSR